MDKEYYWGDSTITLSWLRSHPQKWKTYVANRVAEIQRLTDPSNWYHVSSGDNPADLISRGVLPDELENKNLWWQGPHWLSHDTYPIQQHNETDTQLPQSEMVVRAFNTTTVKSPFLISNYSFIDKLKRITAYCLRFIFNCKAKMLKTNICKGPLSLQELNQALCIQNQLRCVTFQKN